MRYTLPALVVLTLLHSPAPLAAQAGDGPFRLSPTVVGLGSEPTPALRLEVALDRGDVYSAEAARLNASFDADLPVTWDAGRNPETLEVEASVGYLKAFITPPPDEPGGLPSLDPPIRNGFAEIAFEAAAEAAQALGSADVSLGLEAAYEHDQDRLWFVPGVELGFALVDCVGCDVPDDESSWSRRLDGRVRWSVPLAPVVPAFLDPLRVRPAARVFRSWGTGQAVEAIRNKDGLWASVELAYAIDGVPLLHEVHAGWRGGDLPVKLEEEKAWYFGVTVIPSTRDSSQDVRPTSYRSSQSARSRPNVGLSNSCEPMCATLAWARSNKAIENPESSCRERYEMPSGASGCVWIAADHFQLFG
ncbi:MAG: hypothetical protein WD766_15380 [Gemmatimonadota bacterium]